MSIMDQLNTPQVNYGILKPCASYLKPNFITDTVHNIALSMSITITFAYAVKIELTAHVIVTLFSVKIFEADVYEYSC